MKANVIATKFIETYEQPRTTKPAFIHVIASHDHYTVQINTEGLLGAQDTSNRDVFFTSRPPEEREFVEALVA
ncbi:unnamed protein product [Enterobius vermicularis]|uniref:4-oxalocrotonate tautomerase n=1 Tax=Enterobius vermicularis TaxID=51028 RepID=A0A0N4UYJ7_ENTVE|nr:unnamed protein product [Enterobius vermicularis]